MQPKLSQKQSQFNFPSVHWEKFFGKFKEIEALPIGEWKDAHLLGYFCKKYKDHYGLDYTFKFNATSPSKSFEIFKLHSLMHMISSDPTILKDYFDWFFETKIALKKKKITSISFVVEANSANEYKFKKLAMNKSQVIGRTTTLPPNYLSIVEKLGANCKTYGDLAFINRMNNAGSADKESEQLINELTSAGFDLTVLDRVS
jgi:hypothetical protein